MNAPGVASVAQDALARRLAELRESRLSPDWPIRLLAFARDLTLAEAGAVIGSAEGDGLRVLAPAGAETVPEDWAVAARSAWEVRGVSAREAGGGAWLMAAPLDPGTALVLRVPAASAVDRALTRERLALLSAVAQASAAAANASTLAPAAAAAEAARAAFAAESEGEGLAAAAARLAALLPPGARLALGLVRAGRIATLGLSDQPVVNMRTEFARALAMAMEEALDLGAVQALPDPGRTSAAVRAHPGVFAPPGALVVPDREAGACAIVLWRDAPAVSPEAVAGLLRPALGLVGAGSGAGRAREARRRRRWLWPAAAALAALGLLAVLPRADEVVASFVAQPAVVHVVTAPFDGILEASAVRPGDGVSEGEALARLSTRELALEIAAVRARAANDLREAAIARAAGQPAQEMIAELSARRAEAQLALLEHRLALAEIRSPADGVVLAGDLRRSLGQALARGQTLFEIAAAHDLRAEILLPEARAHLVKPGQAGWLAPASDPGARIPVTIERVRPMAEVVQGRNVFRAIALLPEGAGEAPLRPGAEGVARVEVGQTTWLAWALRDAWMALRRLAWL